jgi:hypothetical protein
MLRRQDKTGSTATPSSRQSAEQTAPTSRDRTVDDAVERQRADFGGIKWGSAFFGWLTAIGVAALLTALLSAAGATLGLTKVDPAQAGGQAKTIGISGAIGLLVVLIIAYYAGGYVAGRMARLDGGRQGLGVWLVGLLVTIVLAIAGAVLGAKYNVLAGLNLPRIPVSEGTVAAAGLIALVVIAVATVLAAVLGGKVGTRYHRKLDRVVHAA